MAWLLGDVVFWSLFPHRINRLGARVGATTITDLLVSQIEPAKRRLPKRLIGLAIAVCVGGYVAAQWLAGQKFVDGAFGIEGTVALCRIRLDDRCLYGDRRFSRLGLC
ncbi:MAG: hypothetical protein KL785_06050 [Brevundimonas sp.]|nr:hypothetical protein [Brevundimonas sp.]